MATLGWGSLELQGFGRRTKVWREGCDGSTVSGLGTGSTEPDGRWACGACNSIVSFPLFTRHFLSGWI